MQRQYSCAFAPWLLTIEFYFWSSFYKEFFVGWLVLRPPWLYAKFPLTKFQAFQAHFLTHSVFLVYFSFIYFPTCLEQ